MRGQQTLDGSEPAPVAAAELGRDGGGDVLDIRAAEELEARPPAPCPGWLVTGSVQACRAALQVTPEHVVGEWRLAGRLVVFHVALDQQQPPRPQLEQAVGHRDPGAAARDERELVKRMDVALMNRPAHLPDGLAGAHCS